MKYTVVFCLEVDEVDAAKSVSRLSEAFLDGGIGCSAIIGWPWRFDWIVNRRRI